MTVFLHADTLFAATLIAAAARHDVTIAPIDDLAALAPALGADFLLQLKDRTLECRSLDGQGRQDGQSTSILSLPLPLRIGALFDWLKVQRRHVPAIELGTAGRLEPVARRIVRRAGNAAAAAVLLTEKEVAILQTLATSATANAPISREALLTEVWGYNPEADTHTLETHIYRLRQKLESNGINALLLTGEGGYYLARA